MTEEKEQYKNIKHKHLRRLLFIPHEMVVRAAWTPGES